MNKEFSFDYDYKNNNLFLYNSKSKSKNSIELDDLIIDYDTNNNICALEFLKASNFLKEINPDINITKELLNQIIGCKIQVIPKNNFFLIKFVINFKSKKQLVTPMFIPLLDQFENNTARVVD